MKINANMISEPANPRKNGKDIEGNFMQMNRNISRNDLDDSEKFESTFEADLNHFKGR